VQVLQLEHYNIRTADLGATVRFYTDVLGMKCGDTPVEAPGAFIYDDRGVPVVHVAVVDSEEAHQRLDNYYGKERQISHTGGGAIDHVAFQCDDFAQFREHLVQTGVTFVERFVDQMNLRQIFVHDPNGITIELNFRESPDS
jgi:catechol 2,3-dioxygenase-like lactoylglutathione lyase family enzyme